MPSMPSTTPPDSAEVVLGVDTHKDAHVAAVLTTLGVLLATSTFPTTAAGYRELLAWARGFGPLHRAGVECTGSYGAALTRYLRAEKITVIEVNRGDRSERRRRGKTDTLDAETAARAVLSGRATAIAKAGDGQVEMLRMFKLAKASAVKSRSQAINQLKAVLVRADPALRESMTGLSNPKLFRRCAELTVSAASDCATAAALTLRLLARRILTLTDEINELEDQITTAVQARAPRLLRRYGVGPDTAAALLLTAGDNPERLRSEGSFAALCGVSPIQASSGKTHRRRLNTGGDRQANSALYTITIACLRWDTRTQQYVHRRIAEGKTRREAIRCLKRYISRELYRDITATPDPSSRASSAA
ncbi:IS110 family transposase [Ornithinibacter aureus]|uniref:IS110 family transposase n=2 Tax=Ornithinibacter aureus TaxID=622664 RepID=A0ABP8J7D1_9MICO|nr:transposase [Ornithinibacter aureus]